MSGRHGARVLDRRGLRVVRGEEGARYPKASLWLRGGARLVDLAVAHGLFRIAGPAGVLAALLYLLFADALFHGQSVGKRIFGVKVIYLPGLIAARNRESVLRNAPFGLVMILGMMPDLGLGSFIGGALVIGGVEAWKVVRDPEGIRLGDAWAQTQVIDGKVSIGSEALSGAPAATGPQRMKIQPGGKSATPGPVGLAS